jgi:hypothetical protein
MTAPFNPPVGLRGLRALGALLHQLRTGHRITGGQPLILELQHVAAALSMCYTLRRCKLEPLD